MIQNGRRNNKNTHNLQQFILEKNNKKPKKNNKKKKPQPSNIILEDDIYGFMKRNQYKIGPKLRDQHLDTPQIFNEVLYGNTIESVRLPIHYACELRSEELVLSLLGENVDPNIQTEAHKQTALHIAVRESSSQNLINHLIKFGGDVNIVDSLGWSVKELIVNCPEYNYLKPCLNIESDIELRIYETADPVSICPSDAIFIIFSSLETKYIIRCSQVCKSWNKLADDALIWRYKYESDFEKIENDGQQRNWKHLYYLRVVEINQVHKWKETAQKSVLCIAIFDPLIENPTSNIRFHIRHCVFNQETTPKVDLTYHKINHKYHRQYSTYKHLIGRYFFDRRIRLDIKNNCEMFLTWKGKSGNYIWEQSTRIDPEYTLEVKHIKLKMAIYANLVPFNFLEINPEWNEEYYIPPFNSFEMQEFSLFMD